MVPSPSKDTATSKKKLIVIEGLQGQSNSYSVNSEAVILSMIGKVENGKRVQCINNAYCRENLIRDISINARYTFENVIKEPEKQIDFSAFRLLIGFKDSPGLKDKIFSGKRALNLIEELAGWKKSVITTVNHYSFGKNAWLLTGPPEWMAQPQLVSMASWIMRLATRFGPLNTENYDTLEKHIKDISFNPKNESTPDARWYGREFWDKMYVLITKYKEIFGESDIKKSWVEMRESAALFGVKSGIMTFCGKNSGDYKADYSDYVKETSRKFIEMCKTDLPRKMQKTDK